MKRLPGPFLIAGSLLGIAAAFSPGGVFVLLLVAATGAALHRLAAPKDRAFLTGLFLISFFVRAVLSLTLDLGSWIKEGAPPLQRGPAEYWSLGIVDRTRDYIRMGDSDYYSQRGYCLAQYVSGNREAVVLRRIQEYGYHAYVLVIGWFYYVFGFSPVSVKLLNGWFGSLHVLAVFFLAKSCFQSAIARWAGVGVALFPTLVLWSASNLKEPTLFLFTALLFLLFSLFRKSRRPIRLVLYGGLFLWAFNLACSLGRQEFFLSLVACLTLLFCLEWCVRRRWYAALFLAAAVLIQLNPWAKVNEVLQMALCRHIGFVQGTGMIYRYLPDRLYAAPGSLEWHIFNDADIPVVIRSIPNAVTQYFLKPFPSSAGDGLSVLLIPQMILWYFLLPFALVGAAAGIRWNVWGCGFLLATLSVWVLMGALANSNIGTLIRTRDMVTPIVLIFAAAGLWAFAKGPEGFSREALTHDP